MKKAIVLSLFAFCIAVFFANNAVAEDLPYRPTLWQIFFSPGKYTFGSGHVFPYGAGIGVQQTIRSSVSADADIGWHYAVAKGYSGSPTRFGVVNVGASAHLLGVFDTQDEESKSVDPFIGGGYSAIFVSDSGLANQPTQGQGSFWRAGANIWISKNGGLSVTYNDTIHGQDRIHELRIGILFRTQKSEE